MTTTKVPSMTINQLKEVAKQKQIEVPSKITKEALWNLLQTKKPQAQMTSNPFTGEY